MYHLATVAVGCIIQPQHRANKKAQLTQREARDSLGI